jgi:hypothetical protein
MAKRSSIFTAVFLGIVGIGAVVYLGIKMYEFRSLIRAAQERPAAYGSDYRRTPICDTGDENANDHSKDTNISEFAVVLTEGCFSLGFVKPPRSWGSWRIQFVKPNRATDHVGLWFYGSQNPEGPWKPGDLPDFPYRYPAWRVEGHGTLRFIKTG